MKLLLITLLLAATAYAESFNTAYGYLKKYGVPRAEQIRKAEEAYLNNPESRIVGGVAAQPGQFPYQGGLLISFVGSTGRGVCGCALVSPTRALTAAHCWNDGQNQAWLFEVVLGSNYLFTGGTRVETSAVITHPNWFPLLVRNDIATIYLPSPVTRSSTIAPIALPTGSMLSETFAGETAVASGFGITSDGGSITTNQFLSHVTLNIITNGVCSIGFPLIVQESNICTSGIGGVGTCGGDSGGPLAIHRDGAPVLVGLTSFGSALGCELAFPAAYARVTSYMDFINQHL